MVSCEVLVNVSALLKVVPDIISGTSWSLVPTEGKPPNALEGYAVAMWKERDALFVAGGVDEKGNATNDIWMLALNSTQGKPLASWRVLQEWPASIFAGSQFTERCNFSMTQRDGTPTFWIFGGRNGAGELLNDLYCFDMEGEQWVTPQTLNERPVSSPPPTSHPCRPLCPLRLPPTARRPPRTTAGGARAPLVVLRRRPLPGRVRRHRCG